MGGGCGWNWGRRSGGWAAKSRSSRNRSIADRTRGRRHHRRGDPPPYHRGESIIIVTGRRATRAERDSDEIVLTLSDHNGGSSTVRGSHLLVAVGRAPNTDALNLGAVGVNTDKEGYIPTSGFLQTNIPGIWAPRCQPARGVHAYVVSGLSCWTCSMVAAAA
ncbi:MAG: FAD-dependent oxidoreductase [Anaerolineae bacterium]